MPNTKPQMGSAVGPSKRDAFREALKADLVTRKDGLMRELSQTTSDLINDDNAYFDSVDQASAESDKTLIMQIKKHDRDLLVQINTALRRIDTGAFGICENCDGDISEARLKAFPFTTLCIDCKAEIESEKNRFSPRWMN